MSYDNLLKSINKKKVNNPVFTCYNYLNNKKQIIDSTNVIKFYKAYSDIVSDGEKTYLGEVAENNIPIISEFVFKFEKDEDVFFDPKLIHGLIICHHKVMRELINITSSNAEYICVASEIEPWIENNLKCIKIILRFPYCRIGKDFIQNTFRTKLLKKLRKSKLEGCFKSSTPLGDWYSHLQDVKDIYPLYGSSEDNKQPTEILTGVFGEYKDGICKNLNLKEAYDYKKHQFIINGKCNIDDINILESVDDEEDDNYLILLPIFTSLFYYSSIANIKPNNQEENEGGSSNQSEDNDESTSTGSNLEICLELIDMLNEERFEKDNYFIDIGKALYNASDNKNKEEGLKIWMRIGSDKQIDQDEDYYIDNYETFDDCNITIKTIAWYAKADNIESYTDWHKKWCKPKIKDCLDSKGAQVPVAEALYRVFWLDYFFSKGKWFTFRGHTLHQLSEDVPLRNDITNHFIPYFNSFESQLKSINDNNNADNEATLKETRKMIRNLQTENYRSAIIKSVQTYFWKENLFSILNKNPATLGVKNCVIEMDEEKAFARPGKPEDYITKRIGVNYKYKYNYEHKDIKDIIFYLRQVFPHPDINDFMKRDISSMLYRRNCEKLFRIWIGDTNGSKSVYQKIIRKMLNVAPEGYYCDLPPEFYSAQQKGNGPTPELAQAEDSNIAFSAEPDTDIDIKGPRIKKVAGGDSMFARKNHQDGGSMETTFKPVLVLNEVPDIIGMDVATKTRLSMIPFECRWLRPNEIDDWEKENNMKFPEDPEEQIKIKTFIMDDDFDKNINKLAHALLWLAVNNYKYYKLKKLKNPPYMSQFMTDYWRTNDCYVAFIQENLENSYINVKCKACEDKSDEEGCEECDGERFIKEIDINKSVTATQLHSVFRKWYFEAYPNKNKFQLPDRAKFIKIMSSKDKLGEQSKRRWWGIYIKETKTEE